MEHYCAAQIWIRNLGKKIRELVHLRYSQDKLCKYSLDKEFQSVMIQLSSIQVCRDKLRSNTVMKSCDGSRQKKNAKYNTLGDNWLNIQGLINWLENALIDNGNNRNVKRQITRKDLKMFIYIEKKVLTRNKVLYAA